MMEKVVSARRLFVSSSESKLVINLAIDTLYYPNNGFFLEDRRKSSQTNENNNSSNMVLVANKYTKKVKRRDGQLKPSNFVRIR